MKEPVPAESASRLIDRKIKELGDVRAAVALNLMVKSKPQLRRASGKRAG